VTVSRFGKKITESGEAFEEFSVSAQAAADSLFARDVPRFALAPKIPALWRFDVQGRTLGPRPMRLCADGRKNRKYKILHILKN
jgi:hypothetical protein